MQLPFASRQHQVLQLDAPCQSHSSLSQLVQSVLNVACYLGEKVVPVGLILRVLTGDKPEERNLVGLFGNQIELSMSVDLIELKHPTLYFFSLNFMLKGQLLLDAVELANWDLFD